MFYRYFGARPRYLWLIFYLLLNLIYTILIITQKTLFGETQLVPINEATPVFRIFLLLAGFYIVAQTFWFNLVDKVRVYKIQISDPVLMDKRISWTLAFLQAMFLLYVLVTGSFVAGSTSRDQSLLSMLWVFVPVDVLFFIYYGFYRQSRYFKLNCVIWLMSSLIRGWSGVLLTMIFFESSRLIRARAIKAKHVLWGGLLFLVGYPLIYFLKLFVRYYAYKQNAGFSEFLGVYESIDVLQAMGIALQQVFDRLQLISSSIGVYQLASALGENYSQGLMYPFWLEGIHGLAIDRLFGDPYHLSAGVAFAQQLDPASEVNWNANPTIIGWFFIVPQYASLNFLYALVVSALLALMGKMLKPTEESRDMVWYAWLVLLIPGWYGAFFLYVYAMFLFIVLHMIFNFCATFWMNVGE
ncbi:oligosaccharide repeat unit polymerase [Massilia rhizosphaerae]|uniref:oligosaccharide repeat unit polymerase n=1 Tax=Massilia rhizosphaerae TaxID=2784389 RepID=UPI0018DD0505|nr:oligosaccharide repeat unit polymerase [Massilia rhizosphaerae]